ncbi:MAG: MBL fold metallo-hydrolase, partial [Deltaproteobacteria bacterium]|nr:MBL fold metallo-hydrolase [Deltaproteobacteria bacterium]
HTPESLAYRVEDQHGKNVVYSGDTGFCEELVDLAKGADLLILESSFPDGEEVEGHLTPSQAGRIATLANVNRLVLIHFYPECLSTDITAQCRKSYGGELTLGSDLLHLRI